MARHITELRIETFRGLKELQLKDLGDVNILVGVNNSGKTSVLEAIQIICDPSEYNLMQVARQRENYKMSFFNVKEQEKSIEFNRYTQQTRSSKDIPVIKVKSIQVIDHVVDNAFDELIKNSKIKEKTLTLLKDFEPEITDLRYINDDGRFIPVVESGLPDYLPLSMYGDGMKKALTILNALVSAENGIVMIDAFETAIHTTAMENVFRFMITVAKELNVQLFLTTHSIEAVDKILISAGDTIDDVRVITLKKDENTGKTLSRNLKGSEVQQDRDAFDFEVRV